MLTQSRRMPERTLRKTGECNLLSVWFIKNKLMQGYIKFINRTRKPLYEATAWVCQIRSLKWAIEATNLLKQMMLQIG